MAVQRTSKQKSKDLVDAQLERYRSMRDFAVTSEPSGAAKKSNPRAAKSAKTQAKSPAAGLPFVIQKHAATRLHYDFRLGWKGVLKSWAVAKGPSYLTHDKRLAVQVEDHPIEYGGFEGIIPQGQYGGGTVMLWDNGTWEPQGGHTDVDAGLRDGSLKFTMHGTKMKGNWALIRMGGKAANEKKPNWLLIKEHDSFERSEDDPAITDEKPDSVVTGRTMDEIARNQDHVWNSKASSRQTAQPRPEKSITAAVPKRQKKTAARLELEAYPKEALPKFITPQLASQADAAPAQSGWVHELKLDGYRIEARKDGAKVQLLTRTGLDWTHRMKTIAAAIAELPAQTALLDGEVVVLSDNGTTSFADLQASFKEGANHPLTYFVFDLLHLNGRNLRSLELVERKNLLAALLDGVVFQDDAIRFSEHIETSGEVVFQKACALHAEGIVSKRSTAAYVSGRTSAWIKVKCIYEQEFVIGGFTLPSNGIHGVGALLLGYYDDKGKLIYAGRSGTGFTQKTHRSLRSQLEKLRQKNAPFADMAAAERRKAIWVKPELVAQIGFASWTADNLVRQAAFKGIREDKPAKEVRREDAAREGAGLQAQAKHGTRNEVAAMAVSRASNSSPSKKRAVESSVESNQEHAAVRLTHPDKVLDTESKLTKQQLADYYWAIAEHMLPQIANRPLSLVRCPEGSTNPCFFQKHTNSMLPPGIETVEVPDKKTGKLEPYITLSTRESLAGLAQMSVLEVHAWGSQNNDLEHPDRIVIDLDPDESISWKTLAASAGETRDLFKKLGLKSFLKSTGGKGLHVVVPLEPEHDWPTVKQFAHAIALKLERLQPTLYLTKMSKAARKGRIFVDYLRNERGATAIAPFSPRARAGANVSMPLSWSELEEREHPRFRVVEFDRWKQRLTKDPWKALPGTVQRIDPDKAARILELG
jgi:bifunctional non-homologous end joining protein LigD